MPGLIDSSRASCVGAPAGMKRAFVEEAASYGERYPKKQKVTHRIHHKQPLENIHEYINAEGDQTRYSRDFFNQQLNRAIAIECRSMGFDSARPEAVEKFRGMVDGFMRTFLSQVRKSMSSSRRIETVPHDWIYALKASGIHGSSDLEPHLDTGEVSPQVLQPSFPPPEPAEPPPPDLEGLLGAELSGRADKESRKYIPAHFPAFPPKHSWKASPVFTQRENDPRKIREKATEEGILAEQSLRKLMAAQKAGLQGNKARKQKRSKRMKESDALWQEAMKELIAEEENRDAEEKRRRTFEDGMEDEEYEDEPEQPKPDRTVNLLEGVHVNYDQKFWRKSARGF